VGESKYSVIAAGVMLSSRVMSIGRWASLAKKMVMPGKCNAEPSVEKHQQYGSDKRVIRVIRFIGTQWHNYHSSAYAKATNRINGVYGVYDKPLAMAYVGRINGSLPVFRALHLQKPIF
jgi:hypothetical protein